MRSGLTFLAAIVMITVPATAQFAGEHLAAPADPAMVLGAKTLSAPMQEYVARDESVNDWTRMVTLVQLPWRPGVSPLTMLQQFKLKWQSSCPDSKASDVVAATVGSHQAADVRLDCTRNLRTGKPETMIGRAVLGDEGLYMVQAAVRRHPTAEDVSWANGVIDGTMLCSRSRADARCLTTRDPVVGKPL